MKSSERSMAAECLPYGGWKHCVRLSDGTTELIVTTDVGPRIIRYGFVGGQNFMKEYPAQLGKRGGTSWRIFGGHRLWTAPEERKRTYAPDNTPVEWSWKKQVLTVRKPADESTGIAKEMRIRFDEGGYVHIRHRITNDGRRAVECAPWALTVMAPGGEAVFPMEPFAPHPKALLPVRSLVLWSYTDMSDPRWTWGRRDIRLRQDAGAKSPQKVGFLSRQGWMAYLLNREVFIKRHPFIPGAVYPDMGCNVETFTNDEMLELESLGPMINLLPGRHAEHAEQWRLARCKGVVDVETLASLAR